MPETVTRPRYKCGTRIEIRGFDLDNREVWLPATIRKIMPYMLPLPSDGRWWPVSYDGDKLSGSTLCHESGFRVVDNRAA